jgi:hypothetical protein
MNLFRKPLILALLSLLGCLPFAGLAIAEGDTNSAVIPDTPEYDPRLTNSAPIKVSMDLEEVANLVQFHRASVTSKAGKFTFLLNSGYRLADRGDEHATFAGSRSDRFIKIRVVDGLTTVSRPEVKAGFRGFLASRYPAARVVSQSTVHAGNKTGPAFDLEWTITQGVQQSARVVYIPCGTGVVELTMTVPTLHFDEAIPDIRKVLLTFRSASPNEELEITPLSSRF